MKDQLAVSAQLRGAELHAIREKVFSGLAPSNQERRTLAIGFILPVCGLLDHLRDCRRENKYPGLTRVFACKPELGKDIHQLLWILSRDICRNDAAWLFGERRA